jgi:flagella synthesis protein FlgN
MTMTSTQQISSILKAEESAAAQLLALLESERDSLTSSDAEIMEKMSAKKQPLVVQLEQLSRQREALLKAAGFPAGKDGLDAFIANQSKAEASVLKILVTKLRTTAYACREHNHINGSIVNVNRQYLQKAMSILRGRDMTASSYGPGGEYSSQVVQQPLIGRV